MQPAEALLEACKQVPDDDGPRLVWADAIGGERGELVVIQCDLARGNLPPAATAARRRRERELLSANGGKWSGLGSSGARFEFRRGFVEAIELDAARFVADGEELFHRAPLLRSLTVPTLKSPYDELRRLVDAPAFSRLHGLHLRDPVVFTMTEVGWLDDPAPDLDEAVRVLIESGGLARLSALGISGTFLNAAVVRVLAGSGALDHLDRVWLHQRSDRHSYGVLLRGPQIKSLPELGAHWASSGRAFQGLPPVTELELHLHGVDDPSLVALGHSRAAETVETLRISGTLDGFHAFPQLRTLDFMGEGRSLGGVQLGDPQHMRGVDALPSLRRLRIPYYEAESVLRVARTWGPQLEELVLWHRPAPDVIRQLEEHVAGEVRCDLKRGFDATLL